MRHNFLHDRCANLVLNTFAFRTHDELMAMEKGRYRRLVDTQMRDSQLDLATLRELLYGNRKEEEDEAVQVVNEDISTRDTRGDVTRARNMALNDWKFITMGTCFRYLFRETLYNFPQFLCSMIDYYY